MQIVWQLPSHMFVANVLRNPFYAGAYVWGQWPSEMCHFSRIGLLAEGVLIPYYRLHAFEKESAVMPRAALAFLLEL